MGITGYEIWYNTIGGPVDEINGKLLTTEPYGTEGKGKAIPLDFSFDPDVLPGSTVYYGVRSLDAATGMYSQFAQASVVIEDLYDDAGW